MIKFLRIRQAQDCLSLSLSLASLSDHTLFSFRILQSQSIAPPAALGVAIFVGYIVAKRYTAGRLRVSFPESRNEIASGLRGQIERCDKASLFTEAWLLVTKVPGNGLAGMQMSDGIYGLRLRQKLRAAEEGGGSQGVSDVDGQRAGREDLES